MAAAAISDLPFLTAPDPPVTEEGVLDPLGLSALGDQLADQVLPGLRARMSRPRFLTAIAVAAVVSKGLDDRVASDHVTPAYIVFEWLLVAGFQRSGEQGQVRATPGIVKAQVASESGAPLCAQSYLRSPSVFGFHGVYKPLARHLGLVDDELRLSEHGYVLIKEWQREQRLPGFFESDLDAGDGRALRVQWREALLNAISEARTTRSAGWAGWRKFPEHLAPGAIQPREAALLRQLLLSEQGGTRGEIFELLESAPSEKLSESVLVREYLLPRASTDLAARLKAICAFETVAGLLERSFDWVRHLSTAAGARAIGAAQVAMTAEMQGIARELQPALVQAEAALESSSIVIQLGFSELAKSFDGAKRPEQLFESILARHADVQRAKKPEGKREWFERGADGGIFVRVPYRLSGPPEPADAWNRPYRIHPDVADFRPSAHSVGGGIHLRRRGYH